MTSLWCNWRALAGLGLAILAAAGMTGCGAPEAQFKTNVVYIAIQENQQDAVKVGNRAGEISDALAAMFGTPDEPYVPSLEGIDLKSILDIDRLKMAAGPVGSDEAGKPRGLYRKHCAHCHGVTGDGLGPTAAFLNPYPRDYRPGKYKFKSTSAGDRPTHEDLTTIVLNGVPGTAMPSFRLLPSDEVDALVQYVKYLSIRGEVERSLISTVALELGPKDHLFDLSLRKSGDSAKLAEQLTLLKDPVQKSFEAWSTASQNVLAIPAKPASIDQEMEQSIARGREIFFTTAACNKCHGDSAQGDGQTNDYDFWSKELLTPPDRPDLLKEYLTLGALEPRNAKPRNLRQGIYRGGRRPIDLYWRVMNGIDGTPMPALKTSVLKEGDPADPKKLTQDDVWHLLNYVRSLPYDAISNPPKYDPNFQRERN